jgi:hypothetical protein
MLISGDRIIKGIEQVLRERRGPRRNRRPRLDRDAEGGVGSRSEI